MKVYVVLCTMEGCEECGNEVHVVAVRTHETDAKEIERKHSWSMEKERKHQYPHLHPNYVETIEVEVDGKPDYRDRF